MELARWMLRVGIRQAYRGISGSQLQDQAPGKCGVMQGGQPRGVATLRLRLIRALPCRDANIAGVFVSGQKRVVFGVIKRELRLRSAIEPVIGHMKERRPPRPMPPQRPRR